MCGIAGILDFGHNRTNRSITDMTESLRHRGPDGFGYWSTENKQLQLGHARLRIIDLSVNGNQPMHYQNGRYTITYNGEIYNYIEIRNDLVSKGFEFSSSCDTEVILALYAFKGIDFLNELDGMFAFAIWDNKEKVLVCARDRFGEKPFYFSMSDKSFVFASEIKALFASGISKKFRNEVIFDYFVLNRTVNPKEPNLTCYEGIESLGSGEVMILNQKGIVKQYKYWTLESKAAQKDKTESQLEEEFLDLLRLSINQKLRSDVYLGSSLSGGLDSSSIVSIINSIENGKQGQKTFSARFPGFKKNEGPLIDLFLGQLNNVDSFSVFPDSESIAENFESVCYHQDEPFGSFSVCAQYEVMKEARKQNTLVLLDGQGADEMLAGYIKYYITYLHQLKSTNRNLFIKEELKFREINFTNRKIDLKNDLMRKYPEISSKLSLWSRKAKTAGNAVFNGLNLELVKQFKGRNSRAVLFDELKRHLSYSMTSNDLGGLLRYADRNSMANSVEVRLPFLSHKLAEFVMSLPEEHLINDGWSKFILRNSMSDHLPKEIAWRKEKIGFEPPNNKILNSDFFKAKTNDAINKLKAEKIITKTYDSLNWKYVMMAQYI